MRDLPQPELDDHFGEIGIREDESLLDERSSEKKVKKSQVKLGKQGRMQFKKFDANNDNQDKKEETCAKNLS